MLITASLNGTTATIGIKHGNTDTTLTVADAASLTDDLAQFAFGDAPAVDRSGGEVRNLKQPPYWGGHYWGPGSFPGYPIPQQPHPGFQSDGSVQVFPRGYILNLSDDGVQIITPAGTAQGEGKVSIPRDQIAGLIAQLNA